MSTQTYPFPAIREAESLARAKYGYVPEELVVPRDLYHKVLSYRSVRFDQEAGVYMFAGKCVYLDSSIDTPYYRPLTLRPRMPAKWI